MIKDSKAIKTVELLKKQLQDGITAAAGGDNIGRAIAGISIQKNLRFLAVQCAHIRADIKKK